MLWLVLALPSLWAPSPSEKPKDAEKALAQTPSAASAGTLQPSAPRPSFDDMRLSKEEHDKLQGVIRQTIEENTGLSLEDKIIGRQNIERRLISHYEPLKILMDGPLRQINRIKKEDFSKEILPKLTWVSSILSVGVEMLCKQVKSRNNPLLSSYGLGERGDIPESTRITAHNAKCLVSFFMWAGIKKGVLPVDARYGFLPRLTLDGREAQSPFFYIRRPDNYYEIHTISRDADYGTIEIYQDLKSDPHAKLIPFFVFQNAQNPAEDPYLITQSGLLFSLIPHEKGSMAFYRLKVNSYYGSETGTPYHTNRLSQSIVYNEAEGFADPLSAYLFSRIPQVDRSKPNQQVNFFAPLTFNDAEDEAFIRLLMLENLREMASESRDNEPADKRFAEKVLALLNAEGPRALDGLSPTGALKDASSATKNAEPAEAQEEGKGNAEPPQASDAPKQSALDELIKEAEMDARRAFADRMVAEINASNQSPQSGTSPSSQKQATSKKGKPKRPQSQADKRRAASAKAKSKPESVPLTTDNLFTQRPEMEAHFRDMKQKKRLKYRHFLGLFKHVARDAKADSFLQVNQKGSHVNVHVEGASGQTMVKPHGKKDRSMPASRVTQFLTNFTHNLASIIGKDMPQRTLSDLASQTTPLT